MCKECQGDRELLRFHCVDCDAWTITGSGIGEYYMVQHIWWRIAGGGDGMLCVGCLERRLGFKLCATDFLPSSAVNHTGRAHSERLYNRLTREVWDA